MGVYAPAPITLRTYRREEAIMADQSKIEWTDATWNPITGCSVISPGCTNCYAMKLAGTRLRHHASREGLTVDSKAGPVWNGQVRFNEKWIDQPIRWSKPRMIFVCAHGDLFHENVPIRWINEVFETMRRSTQHVFQVLTKRVDLAATYLAGKEPLPNVWIGVSVEDQERAGRVKTLASIPAAVRWVSAEPLLGPVDLSHWLASGAIHWVVAGGESGTGARRMRPEWALDLRDQCAKTEVAFHFKQWGEFNARGRKVGKSAAGRELDGSTWDQWPGAFHAWRAAA